MRVISLFVLCGLMGCTLEPDITVEVPEGAVENSTVINVEQLSEKCEFQKLTRIEDGSEGFLHKCEDNCCLWVYDDYQCVEQWCLDTHTGCGWSINDWDCWETAETS